MASSEVSRSAVFGRKAGPSGNRGFSLLELIIVMAMLAIFLAIGFTQMRPPSSRVFANDLKIQIQQARYEAIKRNRPVAVVWEASTQRFTTRLNLANPTLPLACSGSTVLVTKQGADYPGLNISSQLASGAGVVWLPNGQARRCDGGLPEPTRTTVSDHRATRFVDITLTGRVLIQ